MAKGQGQILPLLVDAWNHHVHCHRNQTRSFYVINDFLIQKYENTSAGQRSKWNIIKVLSLVGPPIRIMSHRPTAMKLKHQRLISSSETVARRHTDDKTQNNTLLLIRLADEWSYHVARYTLTATTDRFLYILNACQCWVIKQSN